MKKLLALLLSLLMPLCAMAETYGFSMNVETGDEAFLTYVTDALQQSGADAATAEKQASLLQQLFDHCGIDVAFQDTAYSVALRLCGESVMDMSAYEVDDKVLVTSSLLPGYALSSPLEESEPVTFDEPDWNDVAESINAALDTWLSGLEKTESRGIFVGDAFEGGSKCTTWALEDQDVAALLNALLNEEVRAALTAIYVAAGLDGAAILNEFSQRTDNMAQENRYAYLLRVVQDENDWLVGLSLTVSQDGEQVGTASLGFLNGGIKLVIGLGLEKQNYWCELVSTSTDEDDMEAVSINIREWAASKDDTFAYVEGATTPANNCTWQLDIAATDAGSVWDGVFTANGDVLLTTKGTCHPDEMTLNGSISMGSEEARLASISFNFGPADEVPALDATLTECSTTDPADAELSEQLSNQLAAALMARLMKVLPMEQIMQMNQFTLP